MDREKIVTLEDGTLYALMTKWIRTTLNPVAPKYPKVGDTIILEQPYSFFLKAGYPYIVETVEEYEPAHNPDEDGRDIRLSFVGCQHKGLNGSQIMKLLTKDKEQEHV